MVTNTPIPLTALLHEHQMWIENPAIGRRANFSNVTANEINLAGAILSRAIFTAATMLDANLSGTNLIGANLDRTDFQRANLSGADLEDATLHTADFSGAWMSGTILSGGKANNATYRKAMMKAARLMDFQGNDVCFREANLSASVWNQEKRGLTPNTPARKNQSETVRWFYDSQSAAQPEAVRPRHSSRLLDSLPVPYRSVRVRCGTGIPGR